ncbi:hypothetical protein BC939DRAFT_481947 [Gamsiella multidivaricata]|uniref:uncharacterized protein n=1 Tax=Gamsiella multidivaricata TaxID=101098 RepID=UPI00221E9EA9|nr:uncharacterized protein BC939DRAFT_481947 [Gamsiella multidivaricata]KAG0358265.1 hypothetical protein BGZ54_010492 [Gamsiella multidivaricata]KAI7816513.1 hypothetical protein BC939DRAFT_481947 [Gamsiella multidivaricata]
MSSVGQAEVLPLHRHGHPASGSIAQWTSTLRSYLRNLTRRISPSRAILAFLSIVAFYVVANSLSSSSDSKSSSGNRSGSNFSNNNEDPSMLGLSLKERKIQQERERMMLEWDSRANYRTDLSEVGPGRISSYPASLFNSLSSSDQPSTSKYVPVTAVILSWKRKEGTKAVVAHLRRYPFIQEILIWNNNPEIELYAADFADHDSNLNTTKNVWPSVTVFNSVANLHDFSKYTTCSLAKYDYCYLQDDDWINLSLDSLYTVFVDQPESLVTSTVPAMYAQQRTWMFQNPQFDLHTGFSWLGAGSFMPKKAIFKFLMQLGGSNLWKERVQLSDLFFSLWRNQYPVVLSHALAPLDQSSSWSGRIDQWSVVYEHMTDAMVRITTVLSGLGLVQGSPHRAGAKADFAAEEEKPLFKDRHTRSSCTNDKCLFQTDVDMFPAPDSVKWPADPYGRDIHAHEARFRALDYPSAEFVAMHTYHYAVDQDLSTCWRSYLALGKSNYFGVQFVLPVLDLGVNTKSIEIWSTLASTLQVLQNSVVIKASVDGDAWMTCSGEAERTQGSVRFTDVNCADEGKKVGLQLDTRGIQFLRFEVIEKAASPIEICGMRIGDMLL